ncbi:MAG: hypothetical protein KME25_06370 [Symplocastrum torsivum CPER-KK1]|jgi:hypothetical protein|uniref:Uncharacterized protein n=1 Tax=Symplocastrum torsivum CPER-KK1 TaxID=450513 RepID=A0A951PJE5_9CYAN|nr:hypothetical protein [Symplocastrum torsivum CPER-KK1]
MAITYPIIETQLRLIRALQKGYVEALEAGDWQAANYRCFHLHKLCEGLHHLGQMLDKESTIPSPVPQKSSNSWVSSVRSTSPIHALNAPEDTDNKSVPVVSPPPPPDLARYEWGIGFQGIEPPPIDEVW